MRNGLSGLGIAIIIALCTRGGAQPFHATPPLAGQVVQNDEDVANAKWLLAAAPQGQIGESPAYNRRRGCFLKVHFHLGRIQMRQSAASVAGKVAEKEGRLREAVQRWAGKMDTHSTAAPKPTFESVVALEPSEERFARLLAAAYAAEIGAIRSQLKSLHRQIVLDCERLLPPANRESQMLALVRDAQEQEDEGRVSLGGERQIGELASLLSRTLVPVLQQLGRGGTAANAGEAAAKLAAAVSEALSNRTDR